MSPLPFVTLLSTCAILRADLTDMIAANENNGASQHTSKSMESGTLPVPTSSPQSERDLSLVKKPLSHIGEFSAAPVTTEYHAGGSRKESALHVTNSEHQISESSTLSIQNGYHTSETSYSTPKSSTYQTRDLFISEMNCSSKCFPSDISNTTAHVEVVFEATCSDSSCEGKCGKTFDYLSTSCSCHRSCLDYFDCCPDFWKYCVDDNKDTTASYLDTHLPTSLCGGIGCYACTHYFIGYRRLNTYVVARCPVSYQDGEIKDNCDNLDVDKLVNNLIVFHPEQREVYRNIYCALCHEVPVRDIVQFELIIGCDGKVNETQEHFRNVSFTQTISELHDLQCGFQIHKPRSIIFPVKHCLKPDIGLCLTGHTLTYACETFFEPITIDYIDGKYQPKIARNRYCLECSEYRLAKYQCWSPFFMVIHDRIGNLRFSLLFDFTFEFSDDNRMRHSTKMSTDAIRVSQNLANNQTYPHGTPDTFFVRLAGDITSDESTNIIELVLQEVDRLFPSLVDKTLNTISRDSCDVMVFNKTCVVTSFVLKGGVEKNGTRFFEMVDNLSYIINSNRIIEIYELSFSNIGDTIDNICSSKPWSYTPKKFRSLYNQESMIRVSVNSSVARNMDPVNYPLELKWANNRRIKTGVTGLGEKSLTDNATGSFNQSYIGCGRSLSKTCKLEFYTMEKIKRATYLDITQIRGLETAMFLNNGVMLCSDDLERLLVAADSLDLVESLLTIVGCTVSLTCLLITFVTYLLFPELRNLPGKCVMNLVSAIFLAQLLFIIGGLASWRDDNVCLVTAICQHFFWLASFSWTNVMAFDLGRTFGGKPSAFVKADVSPRFWLYFVMAWIAPFLIVGVTVCLDLFTSVSVGYGVNGVCWINEGMVLLVSFVIPVSVHLTFNIVSFAYVVFSIFKIRRLTSKVQTNKNRRSALVIYARISVVMGFTWLVGYFANAFPIPALWYTFIVLNASQGVYLFVAFVLTDGVIKRYKGLCCNKQRNVSTIGMNITATPTPITGI